MTVKEFNKISIQKQRILVAQDVIGQILAEKYLATNGTWVFTRNKKMVIVQIRLMMSEN